MCLLDQYLLYCKQYEAEYGKRCIYGVGSFMELYGIDLPDQKIGNPREITKILNIA